MCSIVDDVSALKPRAGDDVSMLQLKPNPHCVETRLQYAAMMLPEQRAHLRGTILQSVCRAHMRRLDGRCRTNERKLPEMPDDRTRSSSRAPKTLSNSVEIFSPQQELRPGNRYLTEVTDGDADYCVMLCTLPRGVVVPMHSHADRETFYVMSGNPEAFRGDHWEMLSPGDTFDAQDGIRHAWRNPSETSVSMLCVTTMRMARFLRDIAVDDGAADPQAGAQRFLKLAQEHGYWLASGEENAAIGLDINWDGDGN
jgi:quercetin dioxygenase-like cupin family protein